MKKILLVYAPFCTPASPPYSLTNLSSFLKKNCAAEIDVLDLNLEFHKCKFPNYQTYYQNVTKWSVYDQITKEYHQATAMTYSENNKRVIRGEKPEFFEELFKKIREKKPNIIAFSVVYSSQAYYVYALLQELKDKYKDVVTVVGGPAVNEKLMQSADKTFSNELEFLAFIRGENIEHSQLTFSAAPDFSIYPLRDYFTPEPVIPLRTSTTCYYQQCTFCAHYNKTNYVEFPLAAIKETIMSSRQKRFFFIDDMIPAKRLLQIAETLKPFQITWSCQLKPTKDFTSAVLQQLREAGLVLIMWGVESGNQRMLDLMKKETNVQDVENVLENSHNAGIKNVPYILFGFPTETKEEFLETVAFLKKNKQNIDLVSLSLFGLQKGTPIYTNPAAFGITEIIEEKRSILEPMIRYEVREGMTHEEVRLLKKKYTKTFDALNKYPKSMNFFREHMLCLL